MFKQTIIFIKKIFNFKLLNMHTFFISKILIFNSFSFMVYADSQSIAKSAPVEAFSMISVLNMVMGLIVVIALILGLAWVLKKYSRLPGSNQIEMKVLGGLSLGTREKAILIEVDNTRLLVGVAPGHIQTLHVLEQVAEKKSSADVIETRSFQSKLNNALGVEK